MAPSATITDTQQLNGDTITTKITNSNVSSGNGITHSHQLEDKVRQYSRFGNPSLYVTPQHTIELKESPIPIPTETQVLIHVRATGVCGSDLHLWHQGKIGPLVVDHQHILGHEAAGVVLAAGSAVSNLKPGDRVAIEPQIPCQTCFLCTSGKYNLCESVTFSGVCNGGQCKGALEIGRPALICGAGPIGLVALASAKASGAWPLVITDMEEQRLEFARRFVPGVKTYHVQLSKTSLQSAEEIRHLFGCAGGRDVDRGISDSNEYNAPAVVLECTGVEPSVVTAAYTCRRSGLVMVVGVGRSIMNNLPFMHLSMAEIDLKFINRYSDTWPAGINALANGQVLNLDPLVTHTFPLESAVQAMELCADRSKGSIKIQIVDDLELSP
ncbi:hypothetical protein LTR40_003973 [Exophiala xenobiotica]|nr:hypothetical protein LTR40_003973 [Exophiala xenobiotica]